MARSRSIVISAEVLQDELRFLLKTLLRDDLFGAEVHLTEAEKLLENSLSVPFIDYCSFLQRRRLITTDRGRGTVEVTDEGKTMAKDGLTPDLIAALAAHFADRITSGRKAAPKLASMPPGDLPPTIHRQPPPVPHTSADRPVEERPPDVGSRYDLLAPIGEGSLGVVHEARDLVLGRTVALKQLNHVFDYVTYITREELCRRLKEATLSQARMEHPHVLEVHDLDFALDTPQVISRYAAGGSLAGRLARAKEDDDGQLPVAFALGALMQIAYALKHAHQNGVVHGGLKPENVLFDSAGNVLLTDFGMARVTEKGALTGPPVYVGAGATSYMSPEQLHREQVTEAGDIYALGILLYEMLTGQLPGRRSPMPSKKNKGVPAAIDDLFDKMTHDETEDRYADVDALLVDLHEAMPDAQRTPVGTLRLTIEDPYPPKDAHLEPDVIDELPAPDEHADVDDSLITGDSAEWLAQVPSEELPSAEADALDEGDNADASAQATKKKSAKKKAGGKSNAPSA